MPAATVVHVKPWEVRARLLQLGVPLEVLQEAIQQAHLHRNLCTENDAPFIPGTEAWRFALRTIRDKLLLLPSGDWRKDDPGNYSLVINDKIGINICVASADARTGREGGYGPRLTSPKGIYTNAAVERNNYTPDMFPEAIPDEVKKKAASLLYPTWMFLIYTTKEDARAEFAFPGSYDDDGINAWKERIIIPDISIDPTKMTDGRDDSGPDFDIDVRLKT